MITDYLNKLEICQVDRWVWGREAPLETSYSIDNVKVTHNVNACGQNNTVTRLLHKTWCASFKYIER